MPASNEDLTPSLEGTMPSQEIQRQLAALWRANDDNRRQIDAVRQQLEANSQSLLRQEMLLERIAEKLEDFGGTSPPRRCTENAMTLKSIEEAQSDHEDRLIALERADCCKTCKNDPRMASHETALKDNQNDIKSLSRLIYIGMGVLLVIQFIGPILLNVYHK